MPELIRFQSAVPSRSGRHPGVFALVNALGRQGLLTPEDTAWWRDANARMTAAYPDPSTVVPGCYDQQAHPGACAWFKVGSAAPLAATGEYLDVLDRYGVGWIELHTTHPGHVTYEDDVQVVAVPYTYEADWWVHDDMPGLAAGAPRDL